MATIDLTRSLFEPRKRYAGVRMQQGRVITDDDYNEAHAEDAEDTRRTRVDVIGPSGSPDDGFKIEAPSLSGTLVDFAIRAGTMYVGGVAVRLDHDTTFAGQPDWPGIVDDDRARDTTLAAELVYLEVWQQAVSAAEDRELAEPALGGPDSTTRLRTMGRVRRRSVDETSCAAAWAEVVDALAAADLGTWDAATCELRNDLRLQVDYAVGGAPEDLCSPSVTAGYLGAENQAIRVQLVDQVGAAGDGELTWGYDNGGQLYRARVVDATTLELLTAPRDEAHWPLLGQTIEVLPWGAVLVPDADPTTLDDEVLADNGGRAMVVPPGAFTSQGGGHLTTLASSFNPTTTEVTLTTALPAGFNARGAAHVAAGIDTDRTGEDRSALVFVRVWNRGSDLSSLPRIPYTVGAPLTLGNTGVTVTVTGDDLAADAAWIVAVRPSTPDEVYPWALEDGRAPNEVRRFLVPLAVITWSAEIGTVHDCRETFRPLTRLRNCCRYTVGDGEVSHGDFTSIQEAIDNLPAEGGDVCVLPGTYDAEVLIDGRTGVTVHGCGVRSRIVVPAPVAGAVFTIRNATDIKLEALAIESDEGWGIQVNDISSSSADISLQCLRVEVRDCGAVFARNVTGLRIRDCDFEAGELAADPAADSLDGRVPLVFVQGDDLLIERNRIAAPPTASPARRAAGGLQIGGDSSDARILRNRIHGGSAHGVTLGSITVTGDPGGLFFFLVPYWYWDGTCLRLGWQVIVGGDLGGDAEIESAGPLDRVNIDRNHIVDMGGDGIGVPWFFDDTDNDGAPDDVIVVRDLRITANHIEQNHLAERATVGPFLTNWSGHGGIALAFVADAVVEDNQIEGNGSGVPDPVCGVFLLAAEGVTLGRNRILDNGRGGASYEGWRGGIVLPLCGPLRDADGVWDGRATARVTGNQVAAPEGPALYLASVSGTLVVSDNELVTRASFRAGVELPGVGFGIAILILGLGPPFEVFPVLPADAPAEPDDGGEVVVTDNIISHIPDPGESANAFASVVVFGQDDVRFADNVVRCDLATHALVIATLIVASTVQAADNRLRETPRRVFASMYTLAAVNQTSDNLGTHCIFAFETATSSFVGQDNRSIVDTTAPELQYCPDLGRGND